MAYIGLDTMALLSCPVGQQSQTRTDFIGWTDKYLKADSSSEYQYEDNAERFVLISVATLVRDFSAAVGLMP